MNALRLPLLVLLALAATAAAAPAGLLPAADLPLHLHNTLLADARTQLQLLLQAPQLRLRPLHSRQQAGPAATFATTTGDLGAYGGQVATPQSCGYGRSVEFVTRA